MTYLSAMRFLPIAPALVLACAPPAHAAPGDFIRQIQTANGATVIYDIPLASDQGEVISKPLAAESAVFQLYALETAADGSESFTKLDEDTVGTFVPQTTARILSEDPHHVPRTRADRPYGVSVSIRGLGDSPGQGNSNVVHVVRSYALYDSETYQPNGKRGEFNKKFIFSENGDYSDHNIVQLLPEPKDSPTKACGEETFTAYLPGTGNSVGSELSKATIQIWPVADCEIQNIEQGKVYRGIPANAVVVLRDLYPKSETKIQVYPGAAAPGTAGTVLPKSAVTYDTYLPQNAKLVLSDLDESIGKDGLYTLEVLTKTPFLEGAPEIIGSVSFYIKRSISVRGMMSTME